MLFETYCYVLLIDPKHMIMNTYMETMYPEWLPLGHLCRQQTMLDLLLVQVIS